MFQLFPHFIQSVAQAISNPASRTLLQIIKPSAIKGTEGPRCHPYWPGNEIPDPPHGRDNGRRSGQRFCGFRPLFAYGSERDSQGGAGRFTPTTVSLNRPSGYCFSSSPFTVTFHCIQPGVEQTPGQEACTESPSGWAPKRPVGPSDYQPRSCIRSASARVEISIPGIAELPIPWTTRRSGSKSS